MKQMRDNPSSQPYLETLEKMTPPASSHEPPDRGKSAPHFTRAIVSDSLHDTDEEGDKAPLHTESSKSPCSIELLAKVDIVDLNENGDEDDILVAAKEWLDDKCNEELSKIDWTPDYAPYRPSKMAESGDMPLLLDGRCASLEPAAMEASSLGMCLDPLDRIRRRVEPLEAETSETLILETMTEEAPGEPSISDKASYEGNDEAEERLLAMLLSWNDAARSSRYAEGELADRSEQLLYVLRERQNIMSKMPTGILYALCRSEPNRHVLQLEESDVKVVRALYKVRPEIEGIGKRCPYELMAILWVVRPMAEPRIDQAVEEELWSTMVHETRLHLNPRFESEKEYLKSALACAQELGNRDEIGRLERSKERLNKELRDLGCLSVLDDLKMVSSGLEAGMRHEIQLLDRLREPLGPCSRLLELLQTSREIDERLQKALANEPNDPEDQTEFTGRGLELLLDLSKKQVWREGWFRRWVRLDPVTKRLHDGEAGAYACKLRMGIDDMMEISTAVSGQVDRLGKTMQGISNVLAERYIQEAFMLDFVDRMDAKEGA
ncbi:hypothetical protein EJ04DRAFT_169847 [Polyplosphaeria fusca]|uniref:Uncharacterized protein n=1 Tax=Polyplosphaeria fusca TaxID=682080 RepID=A0A9P4V5G0_9PLEO|nr:hypothetical protein EJ04DRAFT_169847 [Polyplosphaeria fusca]